MLNGRVHGGAYAHSQGKFTQKIIKLPISASVYPIAETWVHYDGSYGVRGVCSGC